MTATKSRTRPTSQDTPPEKTDLVDQVVEYLATIDPSLRDRLDEIEADLREQFAGFNHWVSTKPHLTRRRRAQEILSLFNGRNATEVGRRLGISRATVYRVIKQPRLPPLPTGTAWGYVDPVSAPTGIETVPSADSDNGLPDR